MTSGTCVTPQPMAVFTWPHPATITALYLLGCGDDGAAAVLSKRLLSSTENAVLTPIGTRSSKKRLSVATVPAAPCERSSAGEAPMVSVAPRQCAKVELFTVIATLAVTSSAAPLLPPA
jgi:hypothetical protein